MTTPAMTTPAALTTSELPAPHLSTSDAAGIDPNRLSADQLDIYRAGLRRGAAGSTGAWWSFVRQLLTAAARATVPDAPPADRPLPDAWPQLRELDPSGLAAGTPDPPTGLARSRWLAWEYAHAAGDLHLADALAAGDRLADRWTELPEHDDVAAGLDVRRHVALSAYLAHVTPELLPATRRRAAAAAHDLPDPTPADVAARLDLAELAGCTWHTERARTVALALVVRDRYGHPVRTVHDPYDAPRDQVLELTERAQRSWVAAPRLR